MHLFKLISREGALRALELEVWRVPRVKQQDAPSRPRPFDRLGLRTYDPKNEAGTYQEFDIHLRRDQAIELRDYIDRTMDDRLLFAVIWDQPGDPQRGFGSAPVRFHHRSEAELYRGSLPKNLNAFIVMVPRAPDPQEDPQP